MTATTEVPATPQADTGSIPPSPGRPDAQPTDKGRMFGPKNIPFLICHLVPLLAVFTGVTWKAVILGAVLYWTRVFFITAGYHRYFSHRTYRMGRIPQFLMAAGGTMALQKGPLWWAAHHRAHHRYTDAAGDPHSPNDGVFWSHIGWILSDRSAETREELVEDLTAFPELRFLNRFDWLPPTLLGIASYFIAGWPGVVVGFFGSTVLLWHMTFSVNSAAHLLGWRRFETTDTSRNNPIVAFFTMGEGWHNNHHHLPTSARQGFKWWEFDASYYVLKVLSWMRVVSDLRQPTDKALNHRLTKQRA